MMQSKELNEDNKSIRSCSFYQLKTECLKRYNGNMLRIGLTGGIGSGKTTIASLLKENGIPIVDADIIAREVLKENTIILEAIKEKFGVKFIDENGELIRREFGNFIFKNPLKRLEYEEIIMPYIKKEIFNKMDEYERLGKKVCVVDAPTLIEQGLNKYMNFNILVWVDIQTQIERVKERDKLNHEEVLDRISSQMSLNEKRKVVDFIIDNTFTIEETKKQVEKLVGVIKNKPFH